MINLPLPRVRLMRATPHGPVSFESDLLDARIPMHNPAQSEATTVGCHYRTYLSCIQGFFRKHLNMVTPILSLHGFTENLHAIDIISEKHGSDYHPAKIVLHGEYKVLSLVANVAMTNQSAVRLREDFRLLGLLRAKFRTDVLPRQYLLAELYHLLPDKYHAPRLMMLAQWFEGYHEFHLSAQHDRESPRMVVWDLAQGYEALTDEESFDVLRQASAILTFLYDTESFEEVFPWHHASGDFVVGHKQGKRDVRLITVRQYTARPVFVEPSPDNRVYALLLFFSNLSIRMRLDRLDGVGDVVWADVQSVRATTKGFLDGMRNKVAAGYCDPELLGELQKSLISLGLPEMADLFHAIVESYHPAAPDTPVVKEHLVDHIFQVYQSIHEILDSVP